jgi:hypothetical protein
MKANVILAKKVALISASNEPIAHMPIIDSAVNQNVPKNTASTLSVVFMILMLLLHLSKTQTIILQQGKR